ncbi:MAG: PDZ domain-containing protein, partial [Candidatus Eisenbacteria bacterium]|nr:PDZ domain-containing protein [Candidatus Eisenbacteria bacterium]
PGTDVAVLKIDVPANDPPLPVVPLGNSDGVQVGEWGIAVGNPLGELESSMTVGVVSAKGRRDLRIAGGGPAYQNFLQTDASINFGNSGGPLVNVKGEVIGINSAVNPTGQGLGFAIPINMAREVAAQLITEGVIRRGFLGIVPWPLNEDTRARFEISPENTGVLVGTVQEDTPADRAGLQAGDVIVEFNGSAVEDVPDFRKIVADAGVGENVSVLVERDGRMIDLGVVLALRPDTPEQPQRVAPTEEEWLGLQLEQVTGRLMRQFNLQLSEGLVVSQIDMSRPAAESGLKVGDVLLEIDDRSVDDIERFREIVSGSIADEAAMEFLVQRGGERLMVRVNSRG